MRMISLNTITHNKVEKGFASRNNDSIVLCLLVLVREFVVIIKICKSPTFCEHEMGGTI